MELCFVLYLGSLGYLGLDGLAAAAGGPVSDAAGNLAHRNATTSGLADVFRKRVQILKKREQVELVILADGSYSVGPRNFFSELKFIQKVISDVEVSAEAFRLGIIIYSTGAVVHVDHLSATEPADLEKCSLLNFDIPRVKYPGMNTNTKEAMEKAEKIFTRGRRGASRVVFLLTDGFSNMGNPIPAANILKEQGVEIFTFGIKNGNVKELEAVASHPVDEHTYLFASFEEFEGFARRALHEDLAPGTYAPAKNSSFCDNLCLNPGKQGCCAADAVCACGLISGHFACLCPPGHYGSGFIGEGCTLCPPGTYSEGRVPGDVLTCTPCPDVHHVIVRYPATSKAHCVCQNGTEPEGDSCKIVSCPKLSPPANGYFVKKQCSNVINAACGVRCHLGYVLTGSSVRLCQSNGTWSGHAPVCQPKNCRVPRPEPGSQVACSSDDERSPETTSIHDGRGERSVNGTEFKGTIGGGEYPVGTICAYSCSPGHSLVGSKSRACLPMLKWSGLKPMCKSIACASLPELTRGSVKPQNCTKRGAVHAFGSVCRFQCDPGYELKGSKLSNCTGKHGTWTGRGAARRCVDVEPPSIDCPANFSVKTDRDLHFATIKLKLPETNDNSGVKPVVWSKPAFDEDHPLRLIIGETQIEVYSVDGTGNHAYCSFTVNVKDEEKPKVLECRSPRVFFVSEFPPDSSGISWEEPVFDDNSGVPITVTREPRKLSLVRGTTEVTYKAVDAAGNAAFCSLNITILDDPCSERPEDGNASWKCSSDPGQNSTACTVSCPEGFAFAEEGVLALETTCTYAGRKAHWTPDLFRGDVDLFPECSEVTEPEEMPNELIIEGSSAELCDNLDAFSDELTNDVTSGDVNFVITSFCEDAIGPEDMIISMHGNETREYEFLTTTTHGDSGAGPEKGGTETVFTRPTAYSTDSARTGAESKVGRGAAEAQRFDSTTAATPSDTSESFTRARNLVDETTVSSGTPKNYEVLSNEHRTVELSQPESSTDDPNEVEADRRKRSTRRSGKRLRIRISPKGTENGAVVAAFKETLDLIGKHLSERAGVGFPVGQHTVGKSRVCRQGSLLRHGVCVKCPKGTFHDEATSSCTPCPVGHYQEAEGEIRCDPCPEGYSTRKMRRKQAKQCKRICPPGTYGRKPSGTGLALAPCSPCPAGFYQNLRGQTYCEACPNNMTTLRSGAEASELCLADHGAFDSCVSVTCHNGGQCQTHEGFPHCKCVPGFVGSFCETKYDPCGSEPCYNGGSCEASGPESYVCRCLSGFEGVDCKKEADECAPDPCNGRGTCTDLLNAFKCDCAPGYGGLACEEKMHRICEELEPCANGGTCAEIDDDSYVCSCPQGYGGRHCDVFYDCPSDDCSLSGSAPGPASPPPYSCSNVDCGSRMKCKVGRTRKPECVCTDGFRGNNCTEEVDVNVVLTFPRHGVTEYLMVDFPDGQFNEISVCAWIETKDTFNYGTLFSYSTPEQDNAFTLTDYSGLVLYVSGEHVVTDLKANDGFWHFVCVTWESGEGRWEVYLDGSLYSHGTGLSEGVRLRGGGKLVVGQEQDIFGGGFNDVESFAGRITYFDVWDHVLLPSRIDDLFRECDTAFGNLIPWPSFLQRIHGDVEEKKSQFCQSCTSSLHIYRGRIIYGYVGGGKVATYQCDDGFVIKFDSDDQLTVERGNLYHRKCMKFGGWHVQEPKCKRISCGFPGYFPRGQIFGRSYRYGDEIVYKCSEGYRLEGNDTRICLASGTWSGRAPICRGQSTECKKLVAPRHGSMFVFFGGDRSYSTTTLAVGDRVEFTCDKGYVITGFGVLTCTDGGVWDRRPPTCRKVECPVPIEYAPSLSAAGRENKTYHFGDALVVACSGGRVRLMVCGELGTWDSDESGCRTACQKPPPVIENGFVVGEESDGPHFEGETLRVSCYPGFERRGDDVLTCSADGRWTQSRPTLCLRLVCGPPPRPPPSYRIVHAEGHSFGDRIFLQCNAGYESPGEIVIHCQANGRYSRVRNHCTRIHCEKNDLPNGYEADVEGSRHPYGTRIQVECPSSRSPSLRVRGHVVCGADGSWSSVPECLGRGKQRGGGKTSSP